MKSVLTLTLFLISVYLAAQDPVFDGVWVGYMYDDNEEMINYLVIEIAGDSVTQLGFNSETEEYYVMEFDVQAFHADRNNALYYWLNQGGVWSETQSYHMSLVNENKANLIWTRQVNNIKEGDNEVWDETAKGHMERVIDDTYSNPFVEAQSFDYFTIKSVTVSNNGTRLVLSWNNSTAEPVAGTFHGPGSEKAMYITDRNRVNRYAITGIDGATFGTEVVVAPGESKEISILFESIGDLREFDILEPGVSGTTWNFYGVVLSH